MRKIYPESGSLSWLEFPISPDLPSNPYGIKTWRICRQQLLYRHYYPFTHFWYEYLSLMPCWMYSLTDYINAPELQAIQLLPCLLKQLSDTMSLFQHSPRRLGMEWVDIGSLNMQEYGGTLSMIQYQNMPWVALCSYFTGRTDLKDKSWLVWCSEYISRVVRKYQYLYRLIYNTSEFAHLGVYEQLWIAHQFKANNELKIKIIIIIWLISLIRSGYGIYYSRKIIPTASGFYFWISNIQLGCQFAGSIFITP